MWLSGYYKLIYLYCSYWYLSIYLITFFVLVITEKKNSLARLVMWGRTLNTTKWVRRNGRDRELLIGARGKSGTYYAKSPIKRLLSGVAN